MLTQEIDHTVHTTILSAADNSAPVPFLADETCANEAAQMKGERGGRYVETGLDIADIEAGGAGPNQEPINVQSGQIAQFGQAARGELAIHPSTYQKLGYITTMILVL